MFTSYLKGALHATMAKNVSQGSPTFTCMHMLLDITHLLPDVTHFLPDIMLFSPFIAPRYALPNITHSLAASSRFHCLAELKQRLIKTLY